MEPARSHLGVVAARAVALLASACAPDWNNADLQLDVTDFPFSDEDRIAICVEGAGSLEAAAADGLFAFPGIPDAFPRIVTVANAAAAKFTRLLPSRMRPISRSGRCKSFSARRADR